MKQFDYIIAGAGCAGLSLLTRLLQTGEFSNKKILLIDKSPKTANDRTWCFWEHSPGFFEPVVYRKWQQLWFYANGYTELHNIAPYYYKMIRGGDFYKYCFDIIEQHANVTVKYGEISAIGDGSVKVDDCNYTGDIVFNSILFDKPSLSRKQYYLLQHFMGWVIETAQPVFDPQQATLMDFRVAQQPDTTFVYVMPFSATRALVEYTIFSEKVLADEEYDRALQNYVDKYIGDCKIIEKEFGVIPMTNYAFPTVQNSVINIGTAGGQTKASSGYTFQFIQKQTKQIVDNLLRTGSPLPISNAGAGRFGWYDSTLLNILYHNKVPGDYIFTQLFKHNKATDVLRFLDNETSLWEELKIIRVLPRMAFTKAALSQLLP